MNQMVFGNGWATASEIEATAVLFGCNINIWLKRSLDFSLTSFNSENTNNLPHFNILLCNSHFSPLKIVSLAYPPQSSQHNISNTEHSDQKGKVKNQTKKCNRKRKTTVSSKNIIKKQKLSAHPNC